MPGQAATEKWLTGGGDKDTKDSDEVNSEVGGADVQSFPRWSGKIEDYVVLDDDWFEVRLIRG